MGKPYADKDLIVFDLDGTLTKSKAPMDAGMARIFGRLLAAKKVAVIGGGTHAQFRKQIISRLDIAPGLFKNLFIFPTVGTSFYRYNGGWKPVYQKSFPLR